MSNQLDKAISLHMRGQFSEARKIYKSILLSDSKDFQANHLLGAMEIQLKNYQLAKNFTEKAIRINPDHHAPYNNLGLILRELNQYNDSLTAYDKAIELKPDYAEAYNNRGVTNRLLEKYQDAICDYDKAIELKPRYEEAYNNRSIAYLARKEYKRAHNDCCTAIELNFNYPEAYYNRGQISMEIGQLDEAVLDFNSAINLRNNYSEAYYLRGVTFFILQKYKDSINDFKVAISLNKKFQHAIAQIYNALMTIGDWKDIRKTEKILKKKIEENIALNPFITMNFIDSIKIQNKNLINYNKAYWLNNYQNPKLEKYNNSKIHIGYYSGDFREHVMGFLIAEILKFHNKDNFKITAFSLKNSKTKDSKDTIKDYCDGFLDVQNYTDEDIISISKDKKIDIAVDLMGHTSFNKISCFSKRLAPIQINYLGYPGSTGIENIDYIIADKFIIPEEFKKFYSEKIIYMPNCYRPHYISKHSNNKFDREYFSLPTTAFVFGCFNNSFKINPDIFFSWMNILKKTNNSVLWLLESNSIFKNNILLEAKKLDLDPTRLIFRERLKTDEHLMTYKFMDLFLDTFPYNAHTTACESLYEGVPVLTRGGDSFASRVGISLLNNLKLEELIANSQEDYVEKAVKIASNPMMLKNIKEKLKERIKTTNVFDLKSYVKNLEVAYSVAIDKYNNNEKIDDLYIY